jgi:hypothetical protein
MLNSRRFATTLLSLGLAASLAGGAMVQAADPAPSAVKAAPVQSTSAQIDLSFPDGEDWTTATERERMAYLLGIRDMASAEYQLTGPNPKRRTLVEKLVEALDGMTLRHIMEAIDGYYKANPDKQKQSIFEVIWFQLVVPKVGPAKIK